MQQHLVVRETKTNNAAASDPWHTARFQFCVYLKAFLLTVLKVFNLWHTGHTKDSQWN